MKSSTNAHSTAAAAATIDVAAVPALSSRLNDFYELTKPRMNFLVVLTTMVGFALASRHGALDWLLLFHTLIGTVLTAASAAVFNQVIERNRDAKMPRTADRPIPGGRVLPVEGIVYGALLGIVGVTWLAVAVNLITAALGIATLLLYVSVYTPLKCVTSLNTVLGAVPGAIPPMMGFAAVNNALSAEALAAFSILFFWQMPHFLAIAILYKADYQAGGFRMLPCVDQDLKLTGRMIVLYAIALIPISLLLTLLHVTGRLYFAVAIVLGIAFLVTAVRCATRRTRADARILFFASIIYLPLLMAAMMIDMVK